MDVSGFEEFDPDEDFLAECDGKNRYESYSEAAHAAFLARKRLREQLNAYDCAHCYGAHIGRTPKSERRRNRKGEFY